MRRLGGSGRAALIASIPYGGYDCTEDSATALAPLAKTGTVTKILKIIRNNPNGWSRRNGFRVLGRMAERPSEDPAHILVTETRADNVQATLTTRLRRDSYQDVLHDAIWVLDSFFYPYFEMQPQLEAISADTEFYGDLRFRAMAAFARLIWQKQGLLSEHDLDFILGSLQSDDAWIRAEAAYITSSLQEEHLDDAGRIRVVEALNAAWQLETELPAQVFIARALDFYNGSTQLADQLKSDYEAAHLANVATGDGITLRSGLPGYELPAFVSLMEDERDAFFEILGTPFDIPLTGDANDSMTLILFATWGEYIQYMDPFVGFGGNAGGLYLEGSATFYTYQRTPQQSIFTVEELIKHEFGHYLQGRYVYPDQWGGPGYHDQPRGWADEGMGEFLGGLKFDGDGRYTTPLRQSHLNSICGSESYRDLGGLLAQREGYDQIGVFDYTYRWALVYYLMTERNDIANNLYTSFRDGTYTLADFATIAQVESVDALQDDWHTAMDDWCDSAQSPVAQSGSQENFHPERTLEKLTRSNPGHSITEPALAKEPPSRQ